MTQQNQTHKKKLEKLKKDLQAARQELLLISSHHLRTPLTVIRWSVENLQKGDLGKLTKKQQVELENIHLASLKMVELINKLLLVTQLDAGKLETNEETENLPTIIKKVVSEFKTIIKQKQLSIQFIGLKEINHSPVNSFKLHEVLKQVISNAILYTPDKGEIIITTKKNKKEVIIEVKDSGAGIIPADKPKIFSKMFRGESIKASVVEGHGLGLYIAKKILDEMNGKIWFESVKNQGTTFFISIPK